MMISITQAMVAIMAVSTCLQATKMESPKYTILQKLNNFEIRKYAPMNVAFAEEKNTDLYDSKLNTFIRLQRYISGLNDKKVELNLTFPLIDEIIFGNECHSTQYYAKSYYIPEAYQQDPPLPVDNKEKVTIRQMKGKIMCVRKFDGWATRPQILKNAKILGDDLKSEGVEFDSSRLYVTEMSAPWQILNRTNEVAYVSKTGLMEETIIHPRDFQIIR